MNPARTSNRKRKVRTFLGDDDDLTSSSGTTVSELTPAVAAKAQCRQDLNVPYPRIDAYLYNCNQLRHMIKNKHDEELLDFTRCEDEFIMNAIFIGHNKAYSRKWKIPLEFRSSVKRVREYVRLGTVQKQSKWKASIESNCSTTGSNASKHDHGKICMCLRKDTLGLGTKTWSQKHENGYDHLVREAIRNKANATKPKFCNHPDLGDISIADGVLWSGAEKFENGLPKVFAYLFRTRPPFGPRRKMRSQPNKNRKLNICNEYSFRSPDCCSGEWKGKDIICRLCQSVKKTLVKRCKNREQSYNTDPHKNASNASLLQQSPSKLVTKSEKQAKTIRIQRQKIKRLEVLLERERIEKGVLLNPSQYNAIFDNESDKAMSEGHEECPVISKNELCQVMWQQSMQAKIDAERSGGSGKSVRFSPLMIRFGILLKKKLGGGVYETVRKVFNLPSARTVCRFNTMDGHAPDGVCYETLRAMFEQIRNEYNSDEEMARAFWRFCCTLGQDAMHIKRKVIMDGRTGDFAGFVEGALTENAIEAEIDALLTDADTDGIEGSKENAVKRPDLGKMILVFMCTTWDKEAKTIKQVVARYAVDGTMSGSFLAKRYTEVIIALHNHNFFVNSICADGASENRSAHKLLATLKVKDIFQPRKEGGKLPGANHPIAFKHPCQPDKYIFIGGEMPHWVKKIANAVYRSSHHGHRTDLTFRGQKVAIHMIKNVWAAMDNHGFGGIRLTRLTEDHFNRNSYNSMRVYLATQLLSMSVLRMIQAYVESFQDNEEEMKIVDAQYSSLLLLIENIDELVDIWNGNYKKGFQCINSHIHAHIGRLRDILDVFDEWREEAIKNERKEHFIPRESWEDLLHIVYGIEGVAMKYLQEDGSHTMVQRLGGTDCCENEFGGSRAMIVACFRPHYLSSQYFLE